MHFENFPKFISRLKKTPLDKREAVVHAYLHNIQAPVVENNRVHFLYIGNAVEVRINGDLQNGWAKSHLLEKIDCGEKSLFYRSYKVPNDIRVDYKLEVDGNHINDPLNSSVVPSGYGYNSELAMPQFQRTVINKPVDNAKKGRIETLRLEFKQEEILSKELKIYTPPEYQHLDNLPCIYVFDGEDMLNFAGYKNILDNCIHQEKIRPVIAVFIPSKERSDEYLNEKKKHLMSVLEKELMPEIEKNFRVTADPELRALHGISASGYYSLCSVFKRPDLFRKVAAHSSAIKSKLFRILFETMDNGGITEDSKIYFDVGTYDLEVYNYDIPWIFADLNRKFHEELMKYKVPHRYHELHDGHSWANWRERIEEILVYFFAR